MDSPAQAPVDQGSGSTLQPNIIVDDFVPLAQVLDVRVQDSAVQVDSNLAVQTQGDGDSSLRSLTDMIGNDNDMVLDDLDA